MEIVEGTMPIGEVAKATGVGVASLRQWERRFGFPRPAREDGGHRRYSAADIDRVMAVQRHRADGIALGVAIERVRVAAAAVPESIFARLRMRHEQVDAMPMSSRALGRLSRAVEDETAARAEGGLLIGAFQRVAAYRRSEARWRDLVHEGTESFVLADFDRVRQKKNAPTEVPYRDGGPMASEWVLICLAGHLSVCVIGRERPGQPGRGGDRVFDAFLSVEPEVVREAAGAAIEIARPSAERVADAARRVLDGAIDPDPVDQLRLSGQITSRFVASI